MNKDVQDHGNFKHGLTEHPLYHIWASMRYRCNTESYINESWYGRGITVCNEWDLFMNFYNWSLNNGYKKGLTLDRINNDGNYCPENCRWTTYSVQNKNKRKYQSMPKVRT